MSIWWLFSCLSLLNYFPTRLPIVTTPPEEWVPDVFIHPPSREFSCSLCFSDSSSCLYFKPRPRHLSGESQLVKGYDERKRRITENLPQMEEDRQVLVEGFGIKKNRRKWRYKGVEPSFLTVRQCCSVRNPWTGFVCELFITDLWWNMYRNWE